mmetsp:Transcript_19426/g.57809  ORF Transcript_19426/g.57809 Transcript_19426/m.57809 type:complete len:148 (+) Transcript_19426:189-632(+)
MHVRMACCVGRVAAPPLQALGVRARSGLDHIRTSASRLPNRRLAGSPSQGRVTLGQTIKRYGFAALALHSLVYVATLGTVFTALHASPQTVQRATVWIEETTGVHVPSAAGSLAAAWTVTAMTGPARGVVTVIGAPAVARLRWFRRN